MPMKNQNTRTPEEDIDRFLTGRMTPEEEETFRQKLDADEELRKEVSLMRLIVRALSIRAGRYRLMKEWDTDEDDEKTPSAKRRIIPALSAAASAVVILILGSVFLTRHHTLPQDAECAPVSGTPAPEATTDLPTGMRGSVNVSVSVIADEINEARSSAQFAMRQIQAVLADTAVDASASDEEKAYLSKVTAERDYRLRWLRINALISSGHLRQAREELKKFASEPGIYRDDARKLLKEFD